MHLVRIIELNLKVDEDVSFQKVDSPVDLLVLLGLPFLLDWRGEIIKILSNPLYSVIEMFVIVITELKNLIKSVT